MHRGALLIAVLFAFLFCPPFAFSVETPVHQETKDLMQLVSDAARLIQTKGESAFQEFRRPNTRWLHGDTYVFVIDPNGFVYVNPPRPELENRNQIALKDLTGRPFIKSFIREVTAYRYKQEGWTHYVWFSPGQDAASWKTSFVKSVTSPSGKPYIVGSGLYNMKMERIFAVDVVDEAADLIARHGKTAFKEIRDPLGDFNFLTTYVFVFDARGTDVVNPAFPGFEGQNILSLQDRTGKFFIKEIIKGLESSESIWMDYMWPKPRQAAPEKKSSYVRKVVIGNEILYVGSGIYLDGK